MYVTHLLLSYRRHLLCTTMCCLLTAVSAGDALAAFNPDAGSEETAPVSTQALARKRTAPEPMMMINRSAAPLYPSADRGYVKPVESVAMPKPLYPTRTAAPVAAAETVPTPVVAAPIVQPVATPVVATIAPLPDAPIVEPATPALSAKVAAAPRPLVAPAAVPTANNETQVAGYIAPPPPLPDIAPVAAIQPPSLPEETAPATAKTAPIKHVPAQTASAQTIEAAPVDIVEPVDMRKSTGAAMNSKLNVTPPPAVMASSAPAPAPTHTALSPETRAILGNIPARLGATPPVQMSRTNVSRVSPEVSQLIPGLEKEAEYESVGLKITVSRQTLDATYELNRAYEALVAGDSEQAVNIYQDVLAQQPQNQDALFGLAATYHRAGETAKARPLYGALLRMNPDHREALNNFLVLVSEEAPEEALFELQKLAQRNPDFSPIPAQMSIVLEKLGQHDMARQQLLKAIELSPENLVYKYNLAIMMDRQGRYADASALYNLLVEAALRGEHIPAPLDDIQKRLNYINTASNDSVRGG